MKEKNQKTVIRGAILLVETIDCKNYIQSMVETQKEEAEKEVAELKMLRLSLGVMRMDGIRN